MFFKILEHIRKKPVHVRKAIALTVSISITALIAVVWLFSFANYLSESTKDHFADKLYEPVGAMGKAFGEGYDRIFKSKNGFNKDIMNLETQSMYISATTTGTATTSTGTAVYTINQDSVSASSTSR